MVDKGQLSKIKQNTWKAMCAYTHTGGLHVQRWNTENGIEANYSRGEILETVKFAELFAALSVMGLAYLAADNELLHRTHEAFNKRADEKLT